MIEFFLNANHVDKLQICWQKSATVENFSAELRTFKYKIREALTGVKSQLIV